MGAAAAPSNERVFFAVAEDRLTLFCDADTRTAAAIGVENASGAAAG